MNMIPMENLWRKDRFRKIKISSLILFFVLSLSSIAIAQNSSSNSIRIDSQTVNGVKQGPAVEYFSNGSRLKFTFLNGVRNGEAILYSKEDEMIKFSYDKGKLVPPIIGYSSDGTKMKLTRSPLASTVRIEITGITEVFGISRVVVPSVGSKTDESTSDLTNGWIEKALDDTDGPIICYSQKGERRERNLIKGKVNGKGITYTNKGNRIEYLMVNNQFEGPATEYFRNGDIAFYQFIKGKKQGPIKLVHPDGSYELGVFVDNKITGELTKYDSKGNKRV